MSDEYIALASVSSRLLLRPRGPSVFLNSPSRKLNLCCLYLAAQPYFSEPNMEGSHFKRWNNGERTVWFGEQPVPNLTKPLFHRLRWEPSMFGSEKQGCAAKYPVSICSYMRIGVVYAARGSWWWRYDLFATKPQDCWRSASRPQCPAPISSSHPLCNSPPEPNAPPCRSSLRLLR